MSYKVTLYTDIKDLPNENLKLAYSNMDKDYYNVLCIELNGKVIQSETDCGQPEDNSFLRDYNWVLHALREAYNIGKLDALTEKETKDEPCS